MRWMQGCVAWGLLSWGVVSWGVVSWGVVSLAGCSGGTETPPAANADGPPEEQLVIEPKAPRSLVPEPLDYDTPTATVDGFLSALRAGDQVQVAHLLSTKARAEAARHGFKIQPLGSAAAHFEVGEVVPASTPEGGPGAHVHCAWHSTQTDGSRQVFHVAWILRREHDNWRVAGMAARVPGELQPVLMNFEDFDQMQQNRLAAEARFEEQARLQAQALPGGAAAPR